MSELFAFEKAWARSEIGNFRFDLRLKSICEKIFEKYLSSPEIKLIEISNDGYDNIGDDNMTFSISYSYKGKIVGMQVSYYSNNNEPHDDIPSSICFN